MEISELSKDLTIMFIRGNGSPRSFRLKISTLHKWLLALSLIVAGSIIICAIVLVVYFSKSIPIKQTELANTVAVSAPAPVAQVNSEKPATSLWQNINLGIASKPSDESQKELEGLRADNAKLNAQIDARKPLDSFSGSAVVQLLGPNSTMAPTEELLVQIKNTKVKSEENRVVLDFELHNKDQQQTQIRGYILVLAKSRDAVFSYPEGVFSKSENILVDFTKGETFAISRFRQAQAVFPHSLDLKSTNFQIILIRSDGKILASMNVEGNKS